MLTVFRSNRAELLAELLATQLRLPPPGPFEQVQVVVNTWPTSRWLGEQLAMGLGGIAANIRFPFPGSQLRRIVNALVEGAAPKEGSPQNDPWRANQLVWPLLELLPALVQQPEALLLRRWLPQPVEQMGAVVGNTAYFGIPAVLALLPAQAVGYAISYDLVATLFTWSLGPLLLARLMGLNEVQEGVLTIAFHAADKEGLLLLDLDDLRCGDTGTESRSSPGRPGSSRKWP